MLIANEEKLIKDFPKLHNPENPVFLRTELWKGFVCGDGWFNLIYDLSKKMQDYIEDNNLDIQILEIKTKSGQLRVIVDRLDVGLNAIINQAVALAPRICEKCGVDHTVSIYFDGDFSASLCTACRNTNINDLINFRFNEA